MQSSMSRGLFHLAPAIFAWIVAVPALALQDAIRPERVEVIEAVKTVIVRGTAVAVDSDGVDHTATDGAFHIYHEFDGFEEVTVQNGHWEVRFTRPGRIGIDGLHLEGRSIVLDSFRREPPFDDPLEVRGRWIEDLVLSVVDADTGEPLSGIEVIEY